MTKRLTQRTQARTLVGVKGRDSLTEGILNAQHSSLHMERGGRGGGPRVDVSLDTGGAIINPDRQNQFKLDGKTHGHDLPDGSSLEAWIELVHELMVACDVACAVMPVWPTDSMLLSDIALMRIVLDRIEGETELGVTSDFELQNLRASYWRLEMGGTYVRHPRWGTYLRRGHIERIGGLDLVRERVDPAKIVEMGDIIFIQLTDTPESGLTAQAEIKRRALQAVMEPIVAPARPQDLAVVDRAES